MKEWGKAALLALAMFAGLFVMTVGAIQWRRYFGIMNESATTDIYRENKSYVEGTIRDLRDLHVQYVQADDSQKETLAALILHRANELDWDHLPSDVRDFLNDLKGL